MENRQRKRQRKQSKVLTKSKIYAHMYSGNKPSSSEKKEKSKLNKKEEKWSVQQSNPAQPIKKTSSQVYFTSPSWKWRKGPIQNCRGNAKENMFYWKWYKDVVSMYGYKYCFPQVMSASKAVIKICVFFMNVQSGLEVTGKSSKEE